jgi:hypothetical protein
MRQRFERDFVAVDRAWKEGSASTLDQAIDLALDNFDETE